MPDQLLLMTAHHKEDPFLPIAKHLFYPIQVGKELTEIDLKIHSDNHGNHISEKNKTFCELTAYYYAWKNHSEEYVGLMHYRRIFSNRGYFFHRSMTVMKYLARDILYCFKTPNVYHGYSNLISCNKIEDAEKISIRFKAFLKNHLNEYDIYVPRKARLRYLTLEQHYFINHWREDWILFKGLIETHYPFLTPSLNNVSVSKSGYFYNMFIMKRPYFDEYMEILFNLLFKMEALVDTSRRSEFQARLYGFLAERFLNVYMDYVKQDKNIRIKELSAVFIDV